MKLIFMGTPEFAVPTLRALARAGHRLALAVSQPDRPRQRRGKPEPSPVKKAALELGVPVITPERMTDPAAVKAVKDAAADLAAVVAFGHILRPEVLCAPRLGSVNGHASLLPSYRGPAPIQWAIVNGDQKTGVTTILMDAGMDSGGILMQREVEIEADETGATLHDKLSALTADLMVKTIDGYAQGQITPVAQDHSRATLAPMLNKEHGRLDFGASAEELERRVRAFYPWPGTFTTINGEQTRVTRVEVVRTAAQAAPGLLIRADKRGIDVATASGILRVLELQPPGKRPMSAAEFLAGRRLHVGDKLG